MSYCYKMVLLFTCWSCLHLPSKPTMKQLQAKVALKAKLVSVNRWIVWLLGKLFAKLSRYILQVTLFATYSPKNNQSFPCPQCTQPFGHLKCDQCQYATFICVGSVSGKNKKGEQIFEVSGVFHGNTHKVKQLHSTNDKVLLSIVYYSWFVQYIKNK